MSLFQSFRAGRLNTFSRTFSSSRSAQLDVARLTLVGRLGRDPEVKVTKTDKEYVSYVVGTTNLPGPAVDGVRPEPSTTWHRILSFNPSSNNYLRTLEKGSLVFVEANYEMRDPQRDAEPGSPEAQRQVFLRHDTIRVLKKADPRNEDGSL